jgi:hypothetical protein
VAAVLRHADLGECAKVLDSLLAKELVSFSPMAEAFPSMAEMHINPERLGCSANTRQALAMAFERGADFAVSR